jgi:phosphomannomutase
MTLIKSISGIRGTIGGKPGENLTPIDAVQFAAAFADWVKSRGHGNLVVLGRDARLSGKMLSSIVANTLVGCGMDVLDLGLSTTPTVEMAVPGENAAAGIILTASHNPKEWNALKLLNEKGEFISSADGASLIEKIESGDLEFEEVDNLGTYVKMKGWIDKHVKLILERPEVDAELVGKAQFKIALDAVNSTGGIAIPKILKALGVKDMELIYCEPNGRFPHNPEPLAKNLKDICNLVVEEKCDLGIAVDPDVDRLVFIMNDGKLFGEEYTLVAVSDYLLGLHNGGNTVSNLSSTRALNDVTKKHGGTYFASAVGEVNVVEKMKEVNAVIGGEGNGGVIWPDLHYGRDALAGTALLLTYLAKRKISLVELRSEYTHYEMSKDKINLTDGISWPQIMEKLKEKYAHENINTIDGLKIDFEEEWIHLRPSNTEPIIRVYSESKTMEGATELTEKFKREVLAF